MCRPFEKGTHITAQKQIIRTIIQAHQKTQVYGNQFFISWHGVPVLAYTGFCPVLLAIKKEITSRLPDLPKENSGSYWPKTTLGVLKDNITLSFDELTILRNICDNINTRVQDFIVKINQLAVVLFYCRSLEKRFLTETIPLVDPINNQKPPQYHLNQISGILKDFSRKKLKEYLPQVQKTGYRESHYRTPCNGATLIVELKKIPDIIVQFKYEVDTLLPGRYRWFNDDSLHITVRNL